MSTPVTYVGTQYNIPAYQDTGYAQGSGNLSSYLIALATGSLTLSGGSFPLTADADFGANFGLSSIYYKSRAANLSTTGVIRLGSAEVIGWRNNANGANLSLTTTSGDYVSFNGSGLVLPATSNQFVIGTTRTVTLTLPTPASASRTYTFPDLSGNYSVVGTIGTQTISGTKTFDGQLIGKGTATNDSAAAGYIGEYMESKQTSATNFPTTAQYGDGVSLSLTAGDWDVTAYLNITNNSATVQAYNLGISTTSGNSGSGLDFVTNSTSERPASGAIGRDFAMVVPNLRVLLSGTTTYYLKVYSEFTVGTPQYRCILSARRRR